MRLLARLQRPVSRPWYNAVALPMPSQAMLLKESESAAPAASVGEAVIELRDVSKTFPGADREVIRRLTLSVHAGEMLAILGPSGCGKTTTLRLMAGFERPDEGEVTVGGRVVASPRAYIPPEGRDIGFVFQDYALFPHLTVAQNIAFGLRRMDPRQRRRRAGEVLDLVALGGLDKRYPHELSGGQQQRVALARALAPNPVAILMDEPFSNLDFSMRAAVRREVHAILRSNRTTSVIVTHDGEEALSMADRVAVMVQGTVEQVASPVAIYNQPLSVEAARLVGPADFLPGTVRRDQVETEVGFLPYATPGGVAAGQGEVRVMLRPWQVAISNGNALNAPTMVRAEVLNQEFRGSELLYTLRLPSGRLLHSPQRPDHPIRPGDWVWVGLRQGAAAIVFSA